jgi:hypothetical protein
MELDQAKERFKEAWLCLKHEHGPEALAKAYEDMNHANRPDTDTRAEGERSPFTTAGFAGL